jgi:hypothetical protein
MRNTITGVKAPVRLSPTEASYRRRVRLDLRAACTSEDEFLRKFQAFIQARATARRRT